MLFDYQWTFQQHTTIALVQSIQEDPTVIFIRTLIYLPPFLTLCYSKCFLTAANMAWWTSGETCSGDSWTASGTNYLIPGQYNDAFSSVACMI